MKWREKLAMIREILLLRHGKSSKRDCRKAGNSGRDDSAHIEHDALAASMYQIQPKSIQVNRRDVEWGRRGLAVLTRRSRAKKTGNDHVDFWQEAERRNGEGDLGWKGYRGERRDQSCGRESV